MPDEYLKDDAENIYRVYYDSPIGIIEIQGTKDFVHVIDFVSKKEHDVGISEALNECLVQLDEYFTGQRKTFSVRYFLKGTSFQKNVWQELIKIPFGKTLSYEEIAIAVGNKKATRAVGNAIGKNPLSVIVPCHRVVGKNGTLTGYAEGLWRKSWLLRHEGI
jgi:methylated-DNA-[protein]-cysteine S-methyltransferase